MDACPFCAYLAGTRPYTILERDDLTATLVTFEHGGTSWWCRSLTGSRSWT